MTLKKRSRDKNPKNSPLFDRSDKDHGQLNRSQEM